MKTKMLEIPVYETPDGQPTCARDFRTGETCRFLLAQRMGLEHSCVFSDWGQRGRRTPLESTHNGEGFLIPCAECPLHNDKFRDTAGT